MKHDRFVEEVGSFYTSVRSNSTRIAGAIAGVLAIFALIWGVYIYRDRQEHKAQVRLSEAVEIMNARAGDPIPGETTPPKYKTEAEKIAKYEPILKEIANNYSSTDAADVANLFLGSLAADRGDTTTARKSLEEFIDEHPKHLLANSARISLYELRLAGAEAKEAIAELEKMSKETDPALPLEAVLDLLARSYEKAGNDAKAREAYQRLATEYPDSPYAFDAQRKLARS